jgi:hypothetical protein
VPENTNKAPTKSKSKREMVTKIIDTTQGLKYLILIAIHNNLTLITQSKEGCLPYHNSPMDLKNLFSQHEAVD